MRKSRKIALFLAMAMILQCLSGTVVPERAQAADTLNWNGWEYEVDGSVAVITGYHGEETDLVFPEKVPSQEGSSHMILATAIKESAFEGNTKITSVRIPEGYCEMGGEAFSKCTSLQKVELPTTITEWPYHSKYDHGVMQTVTYQYAFAYCTSLSAVVIPEGTTALGMQLFAYCDSLEEIVLPSTLTDWKYAFYRAGGLKRVTIKEGVTKIPRAAFGFCPSLEEVEIPDTVSIIDYEAFSITALKNLTIPRDIQECYSNIEKGHKPGSDLYSKDWVEKETLGTLEIHSMTYQPPKRDHMEKWEKIKVPRYSQSEILLANLPSMEYLPGPDVSNVSIVPYQQEYDGKSHPAVTVTGTQEGDKVSYGATSHGTFSPEVPELTEAESRKIWVRIEREGYYSPYQTQVTASVLDSRPAVIRDLQKEINKADTLSDSKDKYTVESWENYEAATAEGKTLLEKEAALFAELSDALQKLQEARQNLTLKTEQPGTPPPGTTNSPDPGTTSSPEPGTTSSPEPGATSSPAPGTTGSPTPGTTSSPDPGTKGNMQPGGSGRPSATQKPSGAVKAKKTKVAKVVLTKVTPLGRKAVDIRWKKASGAQGYQIMLGTDRKIKKNKKTVSVKGGAKVRRKIKKLRSGKVYYVKVRGWCSRNGKKVYGAWSKIKKVKVK